MSHGFCYILLSKGVGHRPLNADAQLARLKMSLFALRKVWKGGVAVLTDEPLGLPVQEVRVSEGESWNALKCRVHELSPFDLTVYLDNDTIPVAPLGEVFPCDDEEFVTTSWTRSDSVRASMRFAPWVNDGRINLGLWGALRDSRVPLFNTGVFGVRKGLSFAKSWVKHTKWFNEDEIALQVLMHGRVPPRDLGSLYNWQVALWRKRKGPLPEGVRLWHLIGGYCRPINPLVCKLKVEMADAGWIEATDLDRRMWSEPADRSAIRDGASAGV